MAYPGMKPVVTTPCTDNPSPSVEAAAAAVACTAGSLSATQPHLSPLPSSAAKDEPSAFPTKQPATLCVSGERQVSNLLTGYLHLCNSSVGALCNMVIGKLAVNGWVVTFGTAKRDLCR